MDRISLRIVGVLLEKELATPEIYPLTEKALLAGCNQKSNRDPEMSVEATDLRGACLALHADGLVGKVEGQGRVAKFKHRFDDRFAMAKPARAVLAELLCRGPQSPGALLRRIERMGVVETQEGVLQVLGELHQLGLAEKLPRQPRERDWRWGHTMGGSGQEAWMGAGAGSVSRTPEPEPKVEPNPQVPPDPTVDSETSPRADRDDLLHRVASLEAEVNRLRGLLEKGGLA